MNRFVSIRSLLIFAFTLSLLIPVLVLTGYGHFITSRVLANRALEQQSHEVTLQAQHIEQSLEQVRDDARYLSSLRSLRQMQSDTSVRQDVEQDLLVFAASNPMYFRILYLSETASIGIDNSVATPRSITSDALQSERYQAYLQEMKDSNTAQIAVAFDMVWDVPVLRYSLRVDDDAIVMLDVVASWVLRNMPPTQTDTIWALTNQTGQHLLFPIRSESFDDAIPATDAALAPYVMHFQSNTTGMFEAEQSVFVYSRLHPVSNRNVYWVLYQQMQQSDLFTEVHDFYRTGFVIVAVAIVVISGVAMLISGQIIRPLLDLQVKAKEFAQGKLTTAHTKGGHLREVNTLHQSFVHMAEQLDTERQQNQTLIKKLINAQEDERKRIAYDLHDGLIQQLVGANMYISMLQSENDTDQLRNNIKRGSQALSQAIVEGRRMIEGLHPTILDDLGLVDALAEQATQEANRYNWLLDLQLETLPYTPDMTLSVTVFRIVQEALNNIGKHAMAQHVRMTLTNGNAIKLMIEDDGQGFDTQTIANGSTGFGVSTMRERAVLLGGSCEITSIIGKGTTVMIQLPYTL